MPGTVLCHRASDECLEETSFVDDVREQAMENDEIGQVWKEHFPKWQHDRESDEIFRHLCALLRDKAKHMTIPPGLTLDQRLQRVLDACRIPRDQFDDICGANRR